MSVAALVEDSLTCLAAEHPAAHERMSSTLAHRAIALAVDGEPITIALSSEIEARVVVETDVDMLCAILLGECEPLDAVLSDRLFVVGAPDDLAAVGDALVWFVEGAMRCASIRVLVDRLLVMRKERAGG